MKIGLAIYNFDPKKGGAERYAFDLSQRLSKKGHEVFVICSNGISVEDIKLIKVNSIRYPKWLRILFFALEHKKIVKNIKPDVVLGFGNTIEFDVYQSHGGVHKVWMKREIESYDNPIEKALKAFALKTSIHQRIQKWISEYPIRNKSYKKIIAISHMIKKHMIDSYNILEDEIEVVYNGVDTERFKMGEKIKDSGKTRILFSAGNFRLKGLSPLLNALEGLIKERRDILLIVMGRGKKERYTRLIEKKGLKGHVLFTGETAHPELTYMESHFLVHPTFYDACSLTTMEAMASGLPVITTRWNGASTLVTENEGFVIDEPRNIEGLRGALMALMDRERMEAMGRNARLKVQSFTMERNAQEIERILSEAKDGK
ncbi:MAG TPA: glycosyltransferase family 4 protein [Syntrophorhabdaceae bacterium]|nr:glycosyltransferase family 4 protein [Syntrophorhabdaceae bacterium]